MFAGLCTKHPGYVEEKEYRVVHCPRLHPSTRLIKAVEIIGGAPQIVYKIPLQNIPDEGLTGVELPELLDRLIIGPTQHHMATYQAFVDLLNDAGVPDALQKGVCLSHTASLLRGQHQDSHWGDSAVTWVIGTSSFAFTDLKARSWGDRPAPRSRPG